MTARQAAHTPSPSSLRGSRRIAILGAESTGKSWLSLALAQSLGKLALTPCTAPPAPIAHPAPPEPTTPSVQTVPEALRLWCQGQGRTPHAHEQEAIAQWQAQAVEQAHADWVIADTTPLMTAVYSHLLFEDTRLYPMALAHHALYQHTLLTGLDWPWVADGWQRGGPQTRGPVDQLLRQALDQAGLGYKVVYGQGPKRLDNALMALGLPSSASTGEHSSREAAQYGTHRGRQAWQCTACSDPDCERQLFQRLLA